MIIVNAFTVPVDPMVAVSVHAYLPYDFALNPSGTSSFTGIATLESLFPRLQTRFTARTSSSASSASCSVKASYMINNDWGSGYCAVVTVSFSGAGWNNTLAAGASNTSIGFCATR